MTVDEIYDAIQTMSRSETFTPYTCYLRAKSFIRWHLMKSETVTVWRFK